MTSALPYLLIGALLLAGAFLWSAVTGQPLPTALLMPAPLPPVADPRAISLPATPNWALALPPGMAPPAGATTEAGRAWTAPVFPLSAAVLYAEVKALLAGLPRVALVGDDPLSLRLDVVVRTRWLGFPDTVTLQVIDLGSGGTSLIVYGRSRVGVSDLGVNAARIATWLGVLQDRIATPPPSPSSPKG
jgi:uncharacterized protein (DUF1499 family)